MGSLFFSGTAVVVLVLTACTKTAEVGSCLESENLPYAPIYLKITDLSANACSAVFISDWDLGEAKLHGKGEKITFATACADFRKMKDGTNPTRVIACPK